MAELAGRVLGIVGLVNEVHETIDKCSDSGNIARAIVSTVIIIMFVSLVFMGAAFFLGGGLLLALYLQVFAMHLSSALTGGMRSNVCK